MISRQTWAIAALVVTMVIWGSTFVITKAAVREIPPLTLNLLRFGIAALVLLPFAVARGGLAGLPRPVPLGPLAVMGLTGIALFHIAFNYGLVYGSASQGAMIFALIPAAVALAAVVSLKEAPPRRRIAGIALSMGGVALVIAAGEPSTGAPRPLLGALWMLGAVVTWAVYTVYAKRLAAADQVLVIACASALGTAMLAPLAAVELWHVPWPTPSLQAWLGTVFLGVVASAFVFVVYNRVLRELDASLVAPWLNLDPIVGVLTAVLFLGETLGAGQIAGGVVALAGMWLASTEAKKD